MPTIPGWAEAPGKPHVNDPTRTWLDTDPDQVGLPPDLDAIAPASATDGDGAVTLTATGTLFTPDAKITLDGRDQDTTFVSATSLTASVDVPVVGTYPVTVVQAGGETAPQTFTVNAAPAPPS